MPIVPPPASCVDRPLDRVDPVAELLNRHTDGRVNNFPVFFQAAKAFFQPQEVRRQDFIWPVPLAFGGGADLRTHVGLGLAGGQSLVQGNSGQAGGQIMPNLLQVGSKMGIIQAEADPIFQHAQPFPGTICGGI